MVKILQYLKTPSQKVIYLLTLTLVMYIILTGMFSIPMNTASLIISRHSGGMAFYGIGVLCLLMVAELAFLEFVNNSTARHRGQLIFRFLHKFLGWLIFSLATYHSLFYGYYYLWPVAKVTVTGAVTGVCAMLTLTYVVFWGRTGAFRILIGSKLFRHIFATLILILLTILHLNFL